MKNDQPINLRVDEPMFRSIGRLANDIDTTQAEIIRTCIRIAMPIVKTHPYLIKLLPYKTDNSSSEL
jgi:hypothetical protein